MEETFDEAWDRHVSYISDDEREYYFYLGEEMVNFAIEFNFDGPEVIQIFDSMYCQPEMPKDQTRGYFNVRRFLNKPTRYRWMWDKRDHNISIIINGVQFDAFNL